jgi:hypothetical protein
VKEWAIITPKRKYGRSIVRTKRLDLEPALRCGEDGARDSGVDIGLRGSKCPCRGLPSVGLTIAAFLPKPYRARRRTSCAAKTDGCHRSWRPVHVPHVPSRIFAILLLNVRADRTAPQ